MNKFLNSTKNPSENSQKFPRDPGKVFVGIHGGIPEGTPKGIRVWIPANISERISAGVSKNYVNLWRNSCHSIKNLLWNPDFSRTLVGVENKKLANAYDSFLFLELFMKGELQKNSSRFQEVGGFIKVLYTQISEVPYGGSSKVENENFYATKFEDFLWNPWIYYRRLSLEILCKIYGGAWGILKKIIMG